MALYMDMNMYMCMYIRVYIWICVLSRVFSCFFYLTNRIGEEEQKSVNLFEFMLPNKCVPLMYVPHGLTHLAAKEPRRNQDGTKMEPRWNQGGTKTEPRWNQDGTKMEPRRNQDGTKTEPRWNQDGCYLKSPPVKVVR